MKAKLPNGETIEIRKKFKPSINKEEKRNEMIFIRDKLINEHYIMGVKEEPIKPIEQIQEPIKKNETIKKLTMKF